MIDTYLSSPDFALLRDFSSAFTNVIGPAKGTQGQEETTGEDGEIIPAIPVVGDANLWYVCIRSADGITPPVGSSVDTEDGISVLGFWL